MTAKRARLINKKTRSERKKLMTLNNWKFKK